MTRKIWTVTRDRGNWVHRMMFRFLLLTLCASVVRGGYARIDQYPGRTTSDSPLVSRIILSDKSHRFRIRTITAGVSLKNTNDLAAIESAIQFLQSARKKFENEGYEIQTLRIATQPLPEYLNGKSRRDALADLKKIDQVVSAKNVLLSIGPVITDDRHDAEFPSWAAELVKETKNVNFSVAIASPERGVQSQTALTAAEAIVAISKVTPGGDGNFRFTAAATRLAGTPSFPVVDQ